MSDPHHITRHAGQRPYSSFPPEEFRDESFLQNPDERGGSQIDEISSIWWPKRQIARQGQRQ